MATAKIKRKKRTAVVLIHGMGEQVPMTNLRGFVETVWTTDESLFAPDHPAREGENSTPAREGENSTVWGKPDRRNASFELRRITTGSDMKGRRCDFYELYWADLMQGTTLDQVKTWISKLLWRKPSRVPKRLFAGWLGLWCVSLLAIALLLYGAVSGEQPVAGDDGSNWWRCVRDMLPFVSVVAGAFGATAINVVLLKYVGDVARYLSATPDNVQIRQAIRERGVALLERLMTPGEDGKCDYDRVIVVAHSLGGVVGYDALKHAFARINHKLHIDLKGNQPARHALETMIRDAASGAKPLELDAYRAAQTAAREELMATGHPWIVSDFITLGSPLGNAEALMSVDVDDMRRQQRDRILPTCPPELEWDEETGLSHFSYRHWGDRNRDPVRARIPHFASHLAYTRWTNLHSPSSAIFWGDIVSAPVSDTFGLHTEGRTIGGARDVVVMASRKERPCIFTHNSYWDRQGKTGADTPKHVVALRKALDFLNVSAPN